MGEAYRATDTKLKRHVASEQQLQRVGKQLVLQPDVRAVATPTDGRSELFTALPAETRIRRVHRTATRTSTDLGRRARLVSRAHGILEVLDRAANTGTKLGKAISPENDNHDDEDDDQFWQSNTAHGDTPPVPDRPEETDL
jgi:hypothetical protein